MSEFTSENEKIAKSPGGLYGFTSLKNHLFGGGGGDAGTPVGDAYAQLSRDMWDSYVQNFMPYENKLIDYATSGTVVSDAMSNASDIVNQSFDSQKAATARRVKGLGLQLSGEEQAESDKSYGLARSLADVGAQNAVRDETVARQKAILGNPVPTLPQI